MLTIDRLYNNFKTHVGDTVVQKSEFIRLLNQLLIDMKLTKPAEQFTKIYYCKNWNKYAFPTGLRSPIALTNRYNTFFRYVSPYIFNLYKYAECWSEQSDNAKRFMLINHVNTTSQVALVTECDSLTADGTWSISGGSDLAINTGNYKSGSGALSFSVSGTSASITFTRSSVMDVSTFTEFLRMRFFGLFPTKPSSITVKVGTDSSNYFSQDITVQASGEVFATDDYNEIEFAREQVTETGSVDLENIDWVQITLTFASSITDTGFLIDKIELIKPEVLDFEWYTVYVAIDSNSNITESITESDSPTETPLIYDYPAYEPTVLDGLAWLYLKNRSTDIALKYQADYYLKRSGNRMIGGLAWLAKNYPDRSASYRREKRLPELYTNQRNSLFR